MIGTRATALPALLVVAALFAGCKKEVTNEQSTETDPTVDWEVSGDDGGDGSGDTGAEAAMAEDDVQEAGPSLVIVGAAPVEAAAR